MNSWESFKVDFDRGTVIEITVARKAPPGLIFFDFDSSIQGSLHVSELNWNFGLSQRDFRNIKIGESITVYVLEFDDKTQKVFLGRKQLMPKPCESQEWTDLILRKEINATVFEVFRDKVIIQIGNGLFGSIPLMPGKEYNPGSSVKVIPIRKIADINLVDCTLSEIVGSTEEQSKDIVKHYQETSSNNSFITSETCLHSIKQLSNSVYWHYFSEEERNHLAALFEATENLFSKVDKGDEPIYFEFDFNNRAYQEFIVNIAPSIFPSVQANEKNYLTELSKQPFWYTQYFQTRQVEGTDQRVIDKYFSLYNDSLAFWGKIEESNLKILTIKAKVKTDSLKEKQQALKRHHNFLLNRPTVFYYKLSSIPASTYNQAFIKKIDNKLEAFNLFQVAKEKSIDILLKHGKDFKLFSHYLDAQVDYETKAANETEVELTKCWLNKGEIQNELTNFFGSLSSESKIQKDDQVLILRKGKNTQPEKLERGRVLSIRNRTINIACPSIQVEQIQSGCFIKKIVSTKQYKVQLSVLERFFANALPLDNFYEIFHNKDGVLTPRTEPVEFKNERLANPNNPQSQAVVKAVGNQNVLLIQGPPGTGKTTVITEIVKQLIDRGEKILVASPTHVAVDNVLKGIKGDPHINIVRIGHQDTVSDFAQGDLIDEARKVFAAKVQTIVDTKIDLINQKISGQDITQYSANSFQLPYTFDWENISEFISMISEAKEIELKTYAEALKKWKEVIAKSPVILSDVFLRNLDVVFGTCIGIATNPLFSESDIIFDTVILDEAGKANTSETLTAVSRAKKIILVGDHKQLPPYLDKERVEHFKSLAKEYEERPTDQEIKQALGASFFEYLQQDGMLPSENKIMLAVQHRMHPDIGNFVSHAFYDSELANGERTALNVIPLQPPFDKQIVFIDTSSDTGSMETYKDGSYFNQVEAEFIVGNVIPNLIANGMTPENFAIVSPYSRQCERIRELLNVNQPGLSGNLEVATLDSFQGREHDIIIFTFTRSSIDKTVGFLDDARRLNVAFSRARKKLILVGNIQTLTSRHSHFDQYYRELFWKLSKYSRQYGSVYKIKELDVNRLQDSLKEGQIVDGIVKRFEKFGVFVSLGTIDGLIPLKEISWEFVSDPSKYFTLKQKIKSKIIKIDPAGRITLSFKQTIPGPPRMKQKTVPAKSGYELFKEKYSVGTEIEVEIARTLELSYNKRQAFFDLEFNITGIAYFNFKQVKVASGKKVKFKIIKFRDERKSVMGEIRV